MTIPVPPDGSQADSPIDAQTWAVVPRGVLTDARLSDRAVRLYGVLDVRTMGRAQVAIKITTLAEQLTWSLRKTEQAMEELVALGYVTRQRTRGVSLTSVDNPARPAKKSARSAGSCGPDPQDLAGTSRSISSRSKNIIKGSDPAKPKTPAPTSSADGRDRLSPYLLAASEGAGIELSLTRKVRDYLQQISAHMSPEQLRDQVAGWPRISWSGQPIYSSGGFYVDVVLRGIAEGWQPPSSDAPRAAPAQETPIPPRIEELYIEDPCEHGDPRGHRACALCRQGWADGTSQRAQAHDRAVTVGIAACRSALVQSKSISEEIPA